MQNNILSPKLAQIFRISIGAIFGLIIASLVEWNPEAQPTKDIVTSIIATTALSAFIFWAALGTMRNKSLLIWGAIAVGLIGLITYHSFYQGQDNDNFIVLTIAFLIPFLFITHELISSGDQANSIIAPYNIYFDEAWKRGVQLVLALAFNGVFWAILALGAVLFNIIGIKWFGDLIGDKFFAIPASGIAIGAAVHLGDVQTKLLNGFRNLVLSVFSWLLPIIVFIAGLFAISLLFTGLKPLWETKAATFSLLTACMFLVLLINAAYQDGQNIKSQVLQWAIRIGSIETLLFGLIAAYSIGLRVNQYGLTHERVLAIIGVIVASLFGLGYSISILWGKNSDEFMPKIKQINIGMAFVKSVLFFLILTPIADPSRLSVNSQVGRLLAGKIAPDKFDFQFLKYESGRYGKNALDKLSQNSNPQIRDLAQKAKTNDNRYEVQNGTDENKSFKLSNKNITLANGSKPIPNSFFETEFIDNEYSVPECLRPQNLSNQKCDAYIIDLNNDKQDEILIADTNYLVGVYTYENNKWVKKEVSMPPNVTDFEKQFKAGNIKTQKPKWDDIIVGDKKFEIMENN
jgi:Domain of unknown function (DUF4153)